MLLPRVVLAELTSIAVSASVRSKHSTPPEGSRCCGHIVFLFVLQFGNE